MAVLDAKLVEAARKSARLTLTHFEAGHFDPHHPKYPLALTDLRSGLKNFRRLLYSIEPPASDTERLRYLVANSATHKELETLMTRLDPITSGITAIGTAVDGVAAEVAKVAAQLAAGNVTDAEIADAATALTGIATRLAQVKADTDALVEVPGEDDVVEEPPVEPAP